MNEIGENELASTFGGLGLVETVAAAIIVLTVTNIVNNWDTFKAGLMGQPDPSRKAEK